MEAIKKIFLEKNLPKDLEHLTASYLTPVQLPPAPSYLTELKQLCAVYKFSTYFHPFDEIFSEYVIRLSLWEDYDPNRLAIYYSICMDNYPYEYYPN